MKFKGKFKAGITKLNSKIKTGIKASNLKLRANRYISKANRTGKLTPKQLDTIRKAKGIEVNDSTGNITSQDIYATKNKLQKAFDKQQEIKLKENLANKMQSHINFGEYDKIEAIKELNNPELKRERLKAENKVGFWQQHGGDAFKAGAIAAIGAPLAKDVKEEDDRAKKNQQQLLEDISHL